MRTEFILRGTITALQPISIAPPETDPKAAVMPIRTAAGEIAKTFYIPATTLRGRLRREVAHRLLGDAKRSLDDLYATVLGQTRASEEKSEYTDLELLGRLRDANPVTSLFGCGLGLKSRLLVSHAVPIEPTDAFAFHAVRRDLDADERDFDSLTPDDRKLWVARANANSDRATLENELEALQRERRKANKAGSADEVSRLDARIEEVQKAFDHAAELAGTVVSIKQLINYLAVPAGTVFQNEIFVRNGSDPDLGLILTGLDGLSQNPYLGAQQARGCGKVSFEYRMAELRAGVERPLATVRGGDYQTVAVTPVDEATGQRIAAARSAVNKLIGSDVDWSLNRTLKAKAKKAAS